MIWQASRARVAATALGPEWVARSANVVQAAKRAANDWLVPAVSELTRLVARSGLQPDEALSVTVHDWSRDAASLVLRHDASFGFDTRAHKAAC